MFTLRADWRRILTKAWSARAFLAMIVLNATEALVYFTLGVELPIPLGIRCALYGILAGLGLYARVVWQRSVSAPDA